jgi:rhamnosyl/mannosyltransferase
VGGIEKTINLMCEGMKDEFSIRVLIASRKKTLKTRCYDIKGVEIIEAPTLGRFASAPLCPTFLFMLKKLQSDILHFHFPNPTGEISYLLAKPQGKVVVSYHSDIVRQKNALKLYRPFLTRFLDCADVVLPTSLNYIEHSEFLQGIREKCTVLPLGIDITQFAETDKIKKRAQEIRGSFSGPIIVFVGVLRYYKGLHFLLEAMKGINANLVIVGTGPEEGNLRTRCEEFFIKDKVTFTGEVSDDEKVAQYYTADIFCLPSHLPSEAYGVSQIEAMACGLPVVSTALDTGVPFVNKHDESGIIVKPADPSALAEAINSLIKDDTRREALGKQARERANNLFDSRIMIDNLREIYQTLLKRE